MLELYSDAEFTQRYLEALNDLGNQEFTVSYTHEHRPTTGPRMSGLGNCALQLYWELTGAPKTNPRDPASNHSTMLGRAGQEITTRVLELMGYTVHSQEKEVTLADGLITGHVDGELTGLDLGDNLAIWDDKFRSIWGLMGTKNSYGMAVDGLADPGIYLQLQSYMNAESADVGIVLAHPFDLSGIRVQASIKKVPASPVYRMVIEPDTEAQDLAVTRGKVLNACVKIEEQPMREFDPNKGQFPCTYCDFLSLCIAKGTRGQVALPVIPEVYKHPPVTVTAA